jgi:DNA-binding MarR family transcriptional regulator
MNDDKLVIFQSKIQELARDEDLSGRTWRVLASLLGKLDWENWLEINQTNLAKELDIDRCSISTEIRKLVSKGIVIRGPRMTRSYYYKLNINYSFGNEQRCGW